MTNLLLLLLYRADNNVLHHIAQRMLYDIIFTILYDVNMRKNE